MPAADALPGGQGGVGAAHNPFIKPFVVLALPGMYIFYKYNQYKRKRKENARRRLTERELQHLNSKIDKLLSKLEENEPELATCQEEECVICIHAKATMMTAPCGHQVVCRKCFVKTIQIAVSQRLLPLRCVICRAKILRLKTGPVLPSSISGYSVNSRASSGSLLSSSSPSATNHHHQHTTTALLHPHHHQQHRSSSSQQSTATSPSSSSASSSIGGGGGPGPSGASSVSRGGTAGTSGLVPASDSLYSVSSGSTVSSSTSESSSGSSVGSGRGSGRLTCCPCGSSGQSKGHHLCLGAYPRQPTSGSLRRSQQHAMKMRLQEYCRPSGGVGYLPPIKESAANSPIHGSCGQPATPPPSTRIRCAQKIITQLESAPLLGATSSKSYSIQNHRPSQFHKYTESTSSAPTKDSTSKHNNNNNSSSSTKIFKGNKYSKLPNNNNSSEEAKDNNLDVIRLASEEDCSINGLNNNQVKKSSSKRWWKKKSKDKEDKHSSKECNVTEKDDNKRNEQAEKQMELMQKCKKDGELMKESGGKLRFRKSIAYSEEKL